jgi:uncharacterized protein (TIRG00374 family)
VAKHYKVLILVFLSFIGLYYAFESIEFSELYRHIISVNLFKLALAISILMLSCIIRAKRLKYIISPIDTDISTHHLFGATMIGYFGNGILFFRLGELLKAFSISQGNDIKTSESFGVVMLERVIDAITVFILLVFFLPFIPIKNQTIQYWIVAFVVVTFILVSVLILIRFINWKRIVLSFSFLNKSIKDRVVVIVDKIFKGLELIFRTQHFLKIILCTILIWICYFIMTMWLLESCHIELSLHKVFIMLLMGAIIVAVPALPGGLGTYEAGITYTLTLLFFVSKDLSLTYAIVSHASNYIPYMLVGSFYFIKSGLKFGSINKANF